MKIFFHLTIILLILPLLETSAQMHRRKQNGIVTQWEIGLSGGVSSFLTSINPESEATGSQINYWVRDLNPGIGLSVVRNLSPSLGIEINWLNTRLSGTWNDKYPPLSISAGHESPVTFNSKINQFDLMMTFNVNQMLLPGDDEDLWHIYFKTGIGAAQITDSKNFFPGYSPSIESSLVLDAGFSVSLNEKIKFMAGSTFRFVNTDNLDGVYVTSTGYDGQTINYMKVFEIYNYSYLRVSYCLGDFGSKKSKSTFRKKSGKFKVYRR